MTEFVEPHESEYQVQQMQKSINDWKTLEKFDNPTDAENYAQKKAENLGQDEPTEIQIVRVIRFNY